MWDWGVGMVLNSSMKVPGASCTEDASGVRWPGAAICNRGAWAKCTSPGPSGSHQQALEGLWPMLSMGSEGALPWEGWQLDFQG